MILNGSVEPKLAALIERTAVISTVTATEVYFRDMLDLVFRTCKPSFFEPHLKAFFPEKFDITDVLDIYRNSIHPLELVTSSQSFQNIDRIDKVFSKLLSGVGLWDSILKLQVRIKDEPDSETSFAPDLIASLKRVFELRHELVHDPARRSFFTEKTLEDIWASASLVFGADIVLGQSIASNRDPALGSGTDA